MNIHPSQSHMSHAVIDPRRLEVLSLPARKQWKPALGSHNGSWLNVFASQISLLELTVAKRPKQFPSQSKHAFLRKMVKR